jgi:hypothetical protein
MRFSEEELAQYLAEVFANFLPPIASRDPALAAKIEDSLRRGLERLNALPDGDPFWEGTREKPTFHKLQRYLAHEVAKNPDDDDACWALFAYDVCLYAAHFGSPHLEPLVARDLTQIRWLVAGWQAVRIIAANARPELRRSIARLKTRVPDLPARLHELARSSDPALAEAAKIALAEGTLSLSRGGDTLPISK